MKIKDILESQSFSDNDTASDFHSSRDIITFLYKDPAIRAHVGKRDLLYFDDGDLVFVDKTVARLLGSDGWDTKIRMRQIKSMILNMKNKESKQSKSEEPEEKKVGNFKVKLPTHIAGVHGANATELKTPRAIIFMNDEDAKAIKSKLHSPKDGINVRIMKRGNGNQVYIDAKDSKAMDKALEKIENHS